MGALGQLLQQSQLLAVNTYTAVTSVIPNLTPSQTGPIPGTNELQSILSQLAGWGFIAAAFGFIVGAIMWAVGTLGANGRAGEQGKKALFVALIVAVLLGGAHQLLTAGQAIGNGVQ
ncbi:DUF6112 family protein [Ferrimicrobium acidiphilum]|uniref:DUF6112 family protein n=1 Tax=Ferrimicrobium acidiphilum TaxID=121039 RepID=UPI0023F33C99|nr:DUF6112 family protein [Ferrimicrobium acidiphilum]